MENTALLQNLSHFRYLNGYSGAKALDFNVPTLDYTCFSMLEVKIGQMKRLELSKPRALLNVEIRHTDHCGGGDWHRGTKHGVRSTETACCDLDDGMVQRSNLFPHLLKLIFC